MRHYGIKTVCDKSDTDNSTGQFDDTGRCSELSDDFNDEPATFGNGGSVRDAGDDDGG